MIVSFGDRRSEDLFHGRRTDRVRRLPPDIVSVVQRKLDMIQAARTLDDLQQPAEQSPGSVEERVEGVLQHSGKRSMADRISLVCGRRVRRSDRRLPLKRGEQNVAAESSRRSSRGSVAPRVYSATPADPEVPRESSRCAGAARQRSGARSPRHFSRYCLAFVAGTRNVPGILDEPSIELRPFEFASFKIGETSGCVTRALGIGVRLM